MSVKRKRGLFITFEGTEGCGKSTQIKAIAALLKKKKRPFLLVREPGGTMIGERIRRILLDKKNTAMGAMTELLLYCAARAQIVSEVIVPALQQGTTVLCDRFYDSTIAYQGYGLRMDQAMVRRLCRLATQGLTPDMTFLFDVPVRTGLRRAGRTDRIEARSLRYHERVRKGFRMLAKEAPRRFIVIDGTRSIEDVRTHVVEHVCHALGK